MYHLVFSVACSVLVSVLLKLLPRWRVDPAQAVTWNYLAAAALCAAVLQPPLSALRQPDAPWLALLVLAVLLPALFLLLAAAVRRAGIVRSDVAQRLSLLLSLLAAFVWFGERAGGMKLAGLALGLLAVVGIAMRPHAAAHASGASAAARGGGGLLLAVWVGFAVVDVMLKRIAAAGTPFAASLQLCFVIAFGLMLGWSGWRHWRGASRLTLRGVAAGLLLGLLNFGNIVFYVRAHRALPDSPAVVFAGMNIGVVVLGTLVGVLAFGEKTSRWNRIAIVLALLAIGLIAWGTGAS